MIKCIWINAPISQADAENRSGGKDRPKFLEENNLVTCGSQPTARQTSGNQSSDSMSAGLTFRSWSGDH